MGLLAAKDTRSDCVVRGIAYLLRTQKKDGSWDEPCYTGTGFPRVFYLKISHVPAILPADRVDYVQEGNGREKQLANQHLAIST